MSLNCPKCTEKDEFDYLAMTDNLWCEFEAMVHDYVLHTVYYCRHCDWNQSKEFDPQSIHDGDLETADITKSKGEEE